MKVATGCNIIHFITGAHMVCTTVWSSPYALSSLFRAGNGSITNFPFVPTVKVHQFTRYGVFVYCNQLESVYPF